MRTITTTSIVVAGALALFGACNDGDDAAAPPSAPEPDTPGRVPIVVDTDAGLDDAIALLYLASSPEVDLRAVTVSGTGLAHCFPGARNVVGLLEVAGHTDVPVACGPEEPMAPPGAAFPDDWRRFTDGRYGDAWRIGQGSLDDRTAPQLLVDSMRDAAEDEQPATLVALGPLTNIAAAAELDTGFAENVARVVAMAGAFDVEGNVQAAQPPPARNVAEWNVYADPAAARAVVRSGMPMAFVPLDATNSVPLDMYVLRAVARAQESDALVVARTLLTGIRGMIDEGEYYLWDPLAAVLTLQPELGTIEERSVDVVVDGADVGRTTDAPGGAAVEVFTAADARAAEQSLIQTLAGAATDPISDRADLVIDPVACSATGAGVGTGAQIVELAPNTPDGTEWGVAVGVLEPGRGVADIEAFLAAPTEEGPPWFDQAAGLVSGEGGGTADLVELERGTYTVVCIEGGFGDMRLQGTTTFTVG
jgi:pyrimidine-specific ribonucleoside hydrolase